MATYTPNFNDPRVRKKCLSALSFVEMYIKDKGHWLSQREIQKHFGSLSRPLGKYLKDQLLICTDPYFNIQTGQCKKYSRNKKGINFIKQQLDVDFVPVEIPEEITESLATGEFQYQEKGNREYHPLQNLPKRIKKPLLSASGYRHEYDIQCCAQTLLLQHAKKLGMTSPTPFLDQYIDDRTSVRNQLAKELELDTITIKKILTAILNGGSISVWHENQIFSYVNHNRLMIYQLQENQYIQGYQKEIREMWKVIRKTQSLRKGERFNSKMKSEIYRELEESVRVVIKRYLREHKNMAFIEHDGWTCQRAVDIDQLVYEVKRQTGFVIALDWTIHEYVDAY